MASLINGTCHYQTAKVITQINPIFRGYCGRNFFYHAQTLDIRNNLEELTHAYCQKS
jgi:hypothetical protein